MQLESLLEILRAAPGLRSADPGGSPSSSTDRFFPVFEQTELFLRSPYDRMKMNDCLRSGSSPLLSNNGDSPIKIGSKDLRSLPWSPSVSITLEPLRPSGCCNSLKTGSNSSMTARRGTPRTLQTFVTRHGLIISGQGFPISKPRNALLCLAKSGS